VVYVVEKGTVETRRRFGDEEKVMKIYATGEMFGEIALLGTAPSTVTVIAREASSLWSLHREVFTQIVHTSAQARRARHLAILRSVPVLSSLEESQYGKLVDALEELNVPDGQMVVRQDDPGDGCFIVESGSLRAETDGRPVLDYRAGNFFGELCLLRNYPRPASVIATSPCLLLVIQRSAFTRLVGSLQDIMKATSLGA